MKRSEIWIRPQEVFFDPENANRLPPREFQALIDAIRETGGLTENIVVVDLRDDPTWEHPEQPFFCVSGEHRTRAAMEAGIEEIPARAFSSDEWDADMRAMINVRHNIIRGDLDPVKFAKLVNRLSAKYGRDKVRELMKFSDKAKFDKLVDSVTKALPKGVKEQVEKAAKAERIETLDQLSAIVNQAFQAYGNTIPYGFMVFSMGGKNHLWIRLDDETKKVMSGVQTLLSTERKSMNEFFRRLLQDDVVTDILNDMPSLDKPDRGNIFDSKERA